MQQQLFNKSERQKSLKLSGYRVNLKNPTLTFVLYTRRLICDQPNRQKYKGNMYSNC